VERKRKTGTFYAIRFVDRAGTRQWQNLGSAKLGWTRKKAEEVLRDTLTDVARRVWIDPSTVEPPPPPLPTFREFASEWFHDHKIAGGRKGDGLTTNGIADLEWRLEVHLLPWFGAQLLDEITVADVDRYKNAKKRRGEEIRAAAAKGKPLTYEYTDRRGCKHRRRAHPLSNTSINKQLSTLASVLEVAVDRELIPRNVAKVGGRRRRLPSTSPEHLWLDRAEHIAALLDGARQLDEKAYGRSGQRRALIATLVFAGLRIGEALSLRWRDVNLARSAITVRAAKTEAGVRTVNILAVLHDELADYRARVDAPADALVFATSTGARQGETNVRRRILTPAVALANKHLVKEGLDPMPQIKPHGLRRTFASLLFALNEPAPYVRDQMGHTTANLTLELYGRHMDRRDGEPERLQALVNGDDLAQLSLRPAVTGGRPVGTRQPARAGGGPS
jgi:integrase